MDTVVLVHKDHKLFTFKYQPIHHPQLNLGIPEDQVVVVHEVVVLDEIVLDLVVGKEEVTVVMIAIIVQLMKIAMIEMIVTDLTVEVGEVVSIHRIEVHPAEEELNNVVARHIVMIVERENIIVTSMQLVSFFRM